MGDFDFWRLLAGLGVFIYGMFLLEDGISKLSGKRLQQIIHSATNTRFKAVLTGTLSTAVIQSSSAVSLLVLAFVGAGMISGTNAIATVIGSNLGTTFTSWIVAYLGFKIKIEAFSLPLLAIGGLIYIVGNKRKKFLYLSYLVTGFGLIFLGLNFMKESVDAFSENIDLTIIPHYGLFVYVLAGIIITALMQSSSATVAIVLTSVHSGLLEFNEAIGMIIGSNIGTTITVFLGAIGGTADKKRVAWSHLLFNAITGIIALLLIKPSILLIQDVMNLKGNPVIGIAMYHSVFNLAGIIIFYPFIGKMGNILAKKIKDKNTLKVHFIDKVSPDVFNAALEALKLEVIHLHALTQIHNLKRIGIKINNVNLSHMEIKMNGNADPDYLYLNLKNIHNEIISYSLQIKKEGQKEQESILLDKYLHAARDIINSAKINKDLQRNFDWLEQASDDDLSRQFASIKGHVTEVYSLFNQVIVENKIGHLRMVEINASMEEFDKMFVGKTLKLVQIKEISNKEVSDLLMTNRISLQSDRFLLEALEELLKDESVKD